MTTIHVRNPRFEFVTSTPVHWFAGDAISTHLMNAFTLVFPEGERFLVRLMRRAFADTSCPEVVQQFMAQEASHAREHQRYLSNLRASGFRIDGFLRFVTSVLGLVGKLPLSWQLGIGAGAEHLATACGKAALRREVFADADLELRSLFLWHAVEEVEHRAVVFDVMLGRSASYTLRLVSYAASLCIVGSMWLAGALLLLIQDRSVARGVRHRGDIASVSDAVFMARELIRYLHPRFHPADDDCDALIATWRAVYLGLPPFRTKPNGEAAHRER